MVDGEQLRCRPRSMLTDDDLASLKANKPAVLTLLRGESSPTLPAVCFACRGRRLWRSIHGVVTCARCHPPASPHLVAEWLGPSVPAAQTDQENPQDT